MLPGDAIFEARLAGGIHLWDVSHLLPRHAWKRYSTRDPSQIERVFFHHSGALGAEGFQGLHNSARFVVEHRDFPACAYPYWISHEPDRDNEGALVIYRAVHDDRVQWATGGVNPHSTAVCYQGNTSRRPLTSAQIEATEALLPWLYERHMRIAANGWRGLSWHSEASRWGGRDKRSCPGTHAELWLEGYRAGLADVPSPPP